MPQESIVVRDSFLEELGEKDCVRLLRSAAVGRIGVVVDGFPVVVPVNYRVIEDEHGLGLVVRTRQGSVIDRACNVGFELDGIDALHRQGWSVVVRGLLAHIDDGDLDELADAVDPRPWITERESWLVIRPVAITGRRLHPPELEWVLHAKAYL